MQKKTFYIILSLAFIVGFVLPCLAGMGSDNFRIPTSVISSGGAPISSGSFKTDSTLGQSSPLMDPLDPPNSTNYDLYPGFWYTVEAEVELPVVSVMLTPDTTTVPRGGTLGLQATVTNNTNKTGTVYFATKVRLPNGKMYPSSGYLYGPLKFTLDPYKSKSGHLNQNIPVSAPLGTYIYYGYVYVSGVGFTDEDQFEFEVTATTEAEGAEDWEVIVDEDFAE